MPSIPHFDLVEPSEVRVRDVSVSVVNTPFLWRAVGARLKRLTGKDVGVQGQEKKILQNVSAFMPAGSLTALIGGSGSGKTTLLNAMAGRKASRNTCFDGSITFNGRSNADGIGVSYVPQEDALLPTLTVRETLQYAADLSLPPSIGQHGRQTIVQQVIDELDLQPCANTRIGKSCSDGQRRRTTIGTTILTCSPVLLFDEPTTGLDATNAFHIINSLKKLALSGRTVTISIHAPRSEMWSLFDNIVLLSQGQVLYAGQADKVLGYFQKQGHSLQPLVNPADFLVDIAAVDMRSTELEASSQERIGHLARAWLEHRSQRGETPVREATSMHREEIFTTPPRTLKKHGFKRPSFGRQLGVLTARGLRMTLRSPKELGGAIIRAIAMAILNGWIFFNLDGSLSGIRSRQGSLYVASNLNGYVVLLHEVHRFSNDVRVFVRERDNGLVGAPAFLLSRTLSRLFLEDLVCPVLFSVIFYFMVGYRADASRFFVFTLFSILTHYTAISFGGLCVTASHKFSMSTLLANMSFALQSFTSGYFIQIEQIPVYVRWLKWTSYMFYIYSGLCANEFENNSYSCPFPSITSNACRQYNGDAIMQDLGFPSNWIVRPAIAALAFILGFYILTGLILGFYPLGTDSRWRQRPDNALHCAHRMLTTSTKSARTKKHVRIRLEGYTLEAQKRNWLPRKPRYTKTHIVGPITADLFPGQLNVIIGPEGSGKTLLLNSLAKRLPDSSSWGGCGRQGRLLYNGVLPSDNVIRSATSLVTQDDNGLVSSLTVRETLHFAAELRLPSWLTRAEKTRRAEEVLEQMGLKSCADNIVQSDGSSGISGGEKRRVTIAIQLLTDPRILLLDEPTARLDVFTAQSIFDLLDRLAKDGTTVVMTLRQTRASSFCYFSNVLLLATGGQQVYLGHGQDALSYFGSFGHQCPQRSSPTDFIMDLLSDDTSGRNSRLAAEWAVRPQTVPWESGSMDVPAQVGSLRKSQNSMRTTIPVLLRRSVLKLQRNPAWLLARSGQVMGIGIMLMLFYAPLHHDYESVQSRMGFVQEFASLYFVGLSQNLIIYPSELEIFESEEADSCYSVGTFITQYSLMEMPFEIIASLVFGLFTALVCNLQRSAGMVFVCAANCALVLNCGESVGIMLSAVFSHAGLALSIVSIPLALSTVLGGVLSLNVSSFLDALNHLSPIKYLIANLASYSMRKQKFSCTAQQSLPNGQCPIENGTQVLELYKLDHNVALNLGALGICTVAYRLVAYAFLKIRRAHLAGRLPSLQMWLQGDDSGN